jgi:hypothetical protein
MTTIERRRYEMLVRVSDFGKEHGNLFSESSLAREQFAEVAAAVTALSAHAVSKLSAVREGKHTKAMARKALYDGLNATRRTARTMAEDTPDLEDKFHLPDDPTDQALITAGRLFVRDAEAFTAQFIGHGMPATFVADLRGLVEEFEQAIHDREAGKNDQTAARASLDAAFSSGMAAVRKLDAIVTNQLKDPVTMAVWKRARRVGFPRKPREAEGAPAQSAPAPSTSLGTGPAATAATASPPSSGVTAITEVTS